VVIGSNPVVGSKCRCSSEVERLNVLFAPVPQRSPFPSMVKNSGTSLKTKPKHRLRSFLDGFHFAHGEEFGYFDQKMAGLESCRSAKAELH
jgi:hypothetical protein